MPALPQSQFRLADLAARRATPFRIAPSADERAAVADALGITGVKKLLFEGALAPVGRKDWQLTGSLGATVVQDCVVSLAPVTTRIDEDVTRNYVADLPEIDASEIEMPDDDTVDPLPDTIDLVAVLVEALALALPLYPRADGADLAQASFTEPGRAPMTDDDAKPFAGLQALRDALKNKGD